MGTTVFSYHIRDCTPPQVLRALSDAQVPSGYISPLQDHWVSIVDEDCDACRLIDIEQTVTKISRSLDTTVLMTGVYDEDMSFYVAISKGKVCDRYSSEANLEEWEGLKYPGDAKAIARAVPWWQGTDALEPVLKKKYRMYSDQLKDIVRAFEIPDHHAFTNLKDLENPIPLSEQQLAAIPEDSPLGQRVHGQRKWKRFPTRQN